MDREEPWVDKFAREHPIRWWWSGVKFKIERAWHWVTDEPYWTGDMKELRGLRTGRRVKHPLDDDWPRSSI